jgi:hypothetical protein
VCFCIVTPWELGVILTANYTFLNYLVLALGVLLLDDQFLLRQARVRWRKFLLADLAAEHSQSQHEVTIFRGLRQQLKIAKLTLTAVLLSWIFYSTTAQMIWMFYPAPLPTAPVALLDPFRIANRYGLFAVMTRGRYEIEFQGSQDGKTWLAYTFRFKPQDPSKAPGIYAPYQPRFDWNLWFASLGTWREYSIVPSTEIRLLSNDADVLSLFATNPFPERPPAQVRAVIWQYWFTSMSEKRTQKLWWRRQYLGLYAPAIERADDGTIHAVEMPALGSRE